MYDIQTSCQLFALVVPALALPQGIHTRLARKQNGSIGTCYVDFYGWLYLHLLVVC